MLKTSALHQGVTLYLVLGCQVSRESVFYQTNVFQGPASCASQLCSLHSEERAERAPSSSHTYYANGLGRVPQPARGVPSLGPQGLGCRAHPKGQQMLSGKVVLNRPVMGELRKCVWLDIVWIKYSEDYQGTLLFPPYSSAETTGTAEQICTFPSCSCFIKSD